MAVGLPNNSLTEEKTAEKTEPPRREDYKHFLAIPTRWMDNDVYGHVNNVVYYSYFDTVVNDYLIAGAASISRKARSSASWSRRSAAISTPIAFPEVVEAGLRVGKLGNSSVRYEIAIFRQGTQRRPRRAISSMFTSIARHGVPVLVPDGMRQALTRILAAS